MIVCPFCKGVMLACSPGCKREPTFRCEACNVRFVVTNQSYMPEETRLRYWSLVKDGALGKQQVEMTEAECIEKDVRAMDAKFNKRRKR